MTREHEVKLLTTFVARIGSRDTRVDRLSAQPTERRKNMNKKQYDYFTLRERPAVRDAAAEWFHSKWGVPAEAYLACMNEYLSGQTEYGWYLCADGERIIGGLGVIENDFHERKDLAPNVCAVYTEEDCRGQGVAGRASRAGCSTWQWRTCAPRVFRRCISSPTIRASMSGTAGSSSAWCRAATPNRPVCMSITDTGN